MKKLILLAGLLFTFTLTTEHKHKSLNKFLIRKISDWYKKHQGADSFKNTYFRNTMEEMSKYTSSQFYNTFVDGVGTISVIGEDAKSYSSIKSLKSDLPKWKNLIYITFKFTSMKNIQNEIIKGDYFSYIIPLLISKIFYEIPGGNLNHKTNFLRTNTLAIQIIPSKNSFLTFDMKAEKLKNYPKIQEIVHNTLQIEKNENRIFDWIFYYTKKDKEEVKIYKELNADKELLIRLPPKKYKIETKLEKKKMELIEENNQIITVGMPNQVEFPLFDLTNMIANTTESIFWYLQSFNVEFRISDIKLRNEETEGKSLIFIEIKSDSFRHFSKLDIKIRIMNRNLKIGDLKSIGVYKNNRRILMRKNIFTGDKNLDGWISMEIDRLEPLETITLKMESSKIIETLEGNDIKFSVFCEGKLLFKNHTYNENKIFIYLFGLLFVLLFLSVGLFTKLYIKHRRDHNFKTLRAFSMQLEHFDLYDNQNEDN